MNNIPRIRTFYLPKPDYALPPNPLPVRIRQKLMSRLIFLYGEDRAAASMPELERIIQVHCACKPPEMVEKEKHYNPLERFSEKDMILITYGDMVHQEGKTPLATLHGFVNACCGGVINTVHLLPFFPYSSDRGFAIVDFTKVDPRLGDWQDIREHKRRYDLMFDAVLNHCSSRSTMFREFLNGNPLYHNFFISYRSPDDLTPDQRKKIFRPRTSDILTRFLTIRGPRYVWTTFSEDQIDFNFRNPEVLLRIVEGVLFYIRRGADLLRLDAVTYIWADPGTECVHLPQTHAIVKMLREIVDFAASGVALVTETNVPHTDNVSYFGDGTDEAHMVYNFALPPLVLHALYREDSTVLAQWAGRTLAPSPFTTFFNILDTHDGIGLMGVKGILPQEEIDFVIRTARENGGEISWKMTESGKSEPYEINSTWWNAVNGDPSEAGLSLQIDRYLASRSIALVLPGVPGLYIHGILGTRNDTRRAKETGIPREINRGTIDCHAIEAALSNPDTRITVVHRRLRRMLQARKEERAFHPNGPCRVLHLTPAVFAVLRSSPENDRHILAITNVTSRMISLTVPPAFLPVAIAGWHNILGGGFFPVETIGLRIQLNPYEIVWLGPESDSVSEAGNDPSISEGQA